MREDIKARVILLADYVIASSDTVRGAAKKFGVSKSTVHKDLSERLPYLDTDKGERVQAILSFNLSERHIRGGEATKSKYKRGS